MVKIDLADFLTNNNLNHSGRVLSYPWALHAHAGEKLRSIRDYGRDFRLARLQEPRGVFFTRRNQTDFLLFFWIPPIWPISSRTISPCARRKRSDFFLKNFPILTTLSIMHHTGEYFASKNQE